MKKFDLNISKAPTGWNVTQAVKEILANALEEQAATRTQEIEITCDEKGAWHIRDYGRGLNYKHLAQSENEEKSSSYDYRGYTPGLGLKEAIGVFDRFGVEMSIDSKWSHITFLRTNKYGFDGVSTILALVDKPLDEHFVGTEFILRGVSERDITSAKNMFLHYQDIEPLEVTRYGEVYPKTGNYGEIYVNGIKIGQEPYYLFSYNLTSASATIALSLARERTSAGPNAYRERVKAILTHCTSEEVISQLTANLELFSDGTMSDELEWPGVAAYAAKKLNSRRNVLFLTPRQLQKNIGKVGELVWTSGKDIVFISGIVREKIEGQTDDNGDIIATLAHLLR
ncbi:MAG: ATP-binding protein [Lachnospiraceae bacterium]|nr:ATP-binding protein [Lachnospiraceae bacterium]